MRATGKLPNTTGRSKQNFHRAQVPFTSRGHHKELIWSSTLVRLSVRPSWKPPSFSPFLGSKPWKHKEKKIHSILQRFESQLLFPGYQVTFRCKCLHRKATADIWGPMLSLCFRDSLGISDQVNGEKRGTPTVSKDPQWSAGGEEKRQAEWKTSRGLP